MSKNCQEKIVAQQHFQKYLDERNVDPEIWLTIANAGEKFSDQSGFNIACSLSISARFLYLTIQVSVFQK